MILWKHEKTSYGQRWVYVNKLCECQKAKPDKNEKCRVCKGYIKEGRNEPKRSSEHCRKIL